MIMNTNHIPLELQRKHLTKAEIEEKKNSQLKVDKLTKIPQSPSYLNEEQKKIFKKTCKMLIDANLLTAMDIDTIARYAIVTDMYIQLTKKINEDSDLLLDDKIVNKQLKLFKECDSLSNLLCLNIISRNKIVVNNVETEKKENKFTKFIKNSGDIDEK